MEKQDFERLKAVCEKEGFEIEAGVHYDVITVKKKDIWDGVEYVECKNTDGLKRLKLGDIYRLKSDSLRRQIFCRQDLFWITANDQLDRLFQPSTEQSYVDQLKKEALERFGEIQEGDRFDRTMINILWGKNDRTTTYEDSFEFYYNKELDRLHIGNLCIYDSGKWATRVSERVEVTTNLLGYGNPGSHDFAVFFTIKNQKDPFKIDLANEFLGKQLEEYLNK